MPAVELSVPAYAEHVRIVRLVAVATARLAGVADEVLDDVRLAVDEACSRAVQSGGGQSVREPVRIVMDVVEDRFAVTVSDPVSLPDSAADPVLLSVADIDVLPETEAGGPADVAGAEASLFGTVLPGDFGLALVRGLVDDVQVVRRDSGVDVSMSWPVAAPQPADA